MKKPLNIKVPNPPLVLKTTGGVMVTKKSIQIVAPFGRLIVICLN